MTADRTNIVPLHPTRSAGRPAIIARFAFAMLLVAFGLALMLGLFHRSSSTPPPVQRVQLQSATVPLEASDPTPAPMVTPAPASTPPSTVAVPAASMPAPGQPAARIDRHPLVVARPVTTLAPAADTVVWFRDDRGYCGQALRSSVPADRVDPTCPANQPAPADQSPADEPSGGTYSTHGDTVTAGPVPMGGTPSTPAPAAG